MTPTELAELRAMGEWILRPSFYVEARVGSDNHRGECCRALMDDARRNERADELLKKFARAFLAAQDARGNDGQGGRDGAVRSRTGGREVTPTLKLYDLAGPDAAGWSDVAVFVRADLSDSEELAAALDRVRRYESWASNHYEPADGDPYRDSKGTMIFQSQHGKDYGTIVLDYLGKVESAPDDRYESVCSALGLHPETELSDVLDAIQAVRSEARNYPALQLRIEELAAQVATLEGCAGARG